MCQEPHKCESLEQLLGRLTPRLKDILARHRIPCEDSEDLLQDSLLLLIRKGAEIHCPEAYLCSTVHFRCLMYWRTQARQRRESLPLEGLEDWALPEPPPQDLAALRQDLRHLVATLPERTRRLVRLRYALGYTAREVAQQLDLPPDAVRQRSTYARHLLSRRLAEAKLV